MIPTCTFQVEQSAKSITHLQPMWLGIGFVELPFRYASDKMCSFMLVLSLHC